MSFCLRRWLAAGTLLVCCGSVLADDATSASIDLLRSNSAAHAIASTPIVGFDADMQADANVASANVEPPSFSFFPSADLNAPAPLVGHQVSFGSAVLHGSNDDRLARANVCGVPPRVHRSGIFGEALLLRARNSDVAYAAPVNGSVPAGRTGVLDSEFDFGYRVGLIKALDRCHSIVATYTGFNSANDDQITQTPQSGGLSLLLISPDTTNATSFAFSASGRTQLDFHVFDLDYRFLLHGSDSSAINMIIGGRYAHMDQEIDVIYELSGGTEAVSSDINFDGGGVRLGLDMEHHVRHGLYGYGKANASFLAGEFDASYLDTRGGAYRASNAFNAARLVTILDLEVGVGWQARQNLRFSTGYSVSSWFNSITTADWIDGVRDNNNHFADMSQAITFDGFNARAELRF